MRLVLSELLARLRFVVDTKCIYGDSMLPVDINESKCSSSEESFTFEITIQ